MDATTALFEAADHFADLLRHRAVAERWDEPSALEHLSVAALAAHAVQGLVWVDRLLDTPPPEEDVPVEPLADYIERFRIRSRDALDDGINRYARELAVRGARPDPASTGVQLAGVVDRLRERLPDHRPERLLDLRPALPFAMTLDARVRLEVVELVVHGDDLAASAGLDDPLPPAGAVTVTLETLLSAARRRLGDRAVLRAVARKERAVDGVFPVL